LMQQMVEMVRYDSDDLFRAIERENPFSEEAKRAFFTAAKELEDKMSAANGG
jgi:prephenate dehydrogenase